MQTLTRMMHTRDTLTHTTGGEGGLVVVRPISMMPACLGDRNRHGRRWFGQRIREHSRVCWQCDRREQRCTALGSQLAVAEDQQGDDCTHDTLTHATGGEGGLGMAGRSA